MLHKINSIKRLSIIILILTCYVIVTIFIGKHIDSQRFHKHTDTAMIYEVVKNTSTYNLPMSQVLGTAAETYGKISGHDWKQACDKEQIPFYDGKRKLNAFTYHSYFFTYVLAPFTSLFSVDRVVSWSTIGTFFFLLFFLGVAVYKKTHSNILTALSMGILFYHPVFQLGLAGQFYFDRYFIPFAFIYMYFLNEYLENKKHLIPMFLFGLLAASTNERGLMAIVGFSIFSCLFYYRDFLRNKKEFIKKISPILVLSTFLVIIFLFFVFKLKSMNAIFQNEDGYGSMANLSKDVYSISSVIKGIFEKNSLVFKYLFLHLLALPIVISSKKAFILYIVSIIPNLFLNVGGAEKTGFATHYHSQYFPFLLFSFYLGFIEVSKKSFKKQAVLITSICLTLIGFYFYNVMPGFVLKKNHYTNYLIRNAVSYWKNPLGTDAFYNSFGDELRSNIPKDASVSVVEPVFPHLYDRNTLYMYPGGLAVSEYVVTTYQTENNKRVPYAGVTISGNQKLANECFNKKLERLGFDLENPVFLEKNSLILLQKNTL